MALFFRRARPRPPVPPAAVVVAAPVRGTVVPMALLPDEVFSMGMLGPCCGIQPEDGRVYAPLNGVAAQVSSGYSIGIRGADGVELLLHAGVDTIMMKGRGFCPHVRPGEAVRAGQLLLEMDLAAVAAAGHPAVVITVVTNSDEFQAVELLADGPVQPGDPLLRVLR